MTTTTTPMFALTVSPGAAVHNLMPAKTYHLLVSDTGRLPLSVSAEAANESAGCTLHSSSGLTITPSTFHLVHGQSQPVTVTSDIPAGQHADLMAIFAGTAHGTGNAHLSAAVGARFETGTSTVSCTVHHPAALPASNSGGLGAAWIALPVAVLGIGAVVALVTRRRRRTRSAL